MVCVINQIKAFSILDDLFFYEVHEKAKGSKYSLRYKGFKQMKNTLNRLKRGD